MAQLLSVNAANTIRQQTTYSRGFQIRNCSMYIASLYIQCCARFTDVQPLAHWISVSTNNVYPSAVGIFQGLVDCLEAKLSDRGHGSWTHRETVRISLLPNYPCPGYNGALVVMVSIQDSTCQREMCMCANRPFMKLVCRAPHGHKTYIFAHILLVPVIHARRYQPCSRPEAKPSIGF